MLDLQAGRIDGYISDIPALLYYVKDKPQFAVVERIKTTEQYSVMFAKDAPLATKVNDVITEMKKDGTLAEIHEKWFGTKPDDGLATVDRAGHAEALIGHRRRARAEAARSGGDQAGGAGHVDLRHVPQRTASSSRRCR